jgi:rare lipoprotein A
MTLHRLFLTPAIKRPFHQILRTLGLRTAGLALLPVVGLIGCGGVPPAPEKSRPEATASVTRPASKPSVIPALPRAGSGRGGYYQDDGPGENIPDGLIDTPDAEPRIEPYRPQNSRPYTVLGNTYVPQVDDKPFKQRGIGSWYGKKFHGQKTASGELYDMYKMTAAHPTLPIPSYARVTHLSTGKQVIVKINDRGPFHSGRIIDLSFTAALKLGYLGSGSGMLEVERLLPAEIARMKSGDTESVQIAKAQPVQTSTPVFAPVSTQAPAPTSIPTSKAIPDSVPAPTSASLPLSPAQAVPAPGIAAAVAVATYADPARNDIIMPASEQKPASQAGPGFYLQVGSFSQAANAETARNRMQVQHGEFLPGLETVAMGAWHKLLSGPYQSRQDALEAAIRLQASAGIKSVIVQR